jgi:hypothetical protein
MPSSGVQVRLVSLYSVCQRVTAVDQLVQRRLAQATEALPNAFVHPRNRADALRAG